MRRIFLRDGMVSRIAEMLNYIWDISAGPTVRAAVSGSGGVGTGESVVETTAVTDTNYAIA